MRIAVIYTGATRTIESTIQHFKKNVLLNDNYHVFSVVQSDNINHHNHLIRETIGDNLKSIEWFDKDNIDWIKIRDELLNNMNISERWKHYLRTSGSMIEYYQLYLAYQIMELYETENNIKYDFVLRFRTDTVLKDMIRFETIFEKEYITNFVHKIKNELHIDIVSEQFIDIFMNTFYNENRILYKNIQFQNKKHLSLLHLTDEESFIDGIIHYLNHGDYLITVRKNVIYFSRRDVMTHLHLIGITYGEYKDSHEYWFDSETQLEKICDTYYIDKYNSTTSLEDKSLYEYNHIHYYDQDELKGEYSFFIKRH